MIISNYKKRIQIFFLIIFIAAAICVIKKYIDLEIKYLKNIIKAPRRSNFLLSRDLIPLRNVLVEQDHYCFPCELDEISEHVISTVVFAEDKRFFDHFGVDVLSVLRAIYQNILNVRIVSGASTITSQLVKINIRTERTILGKLKEFFRSILIERIYSKEKILENYLNTVYWSHMNRGIKAASLFYFNKIPKYLSLKESAMLAILLRAPNQFDLYSYYDKTQKRADDLITKMYDKNIINKNDFTSAISEHPQLSALKCSNIMPHYYNSYYKNISSFKNIKTGIDYFLQVDIQNEVNEFLDQNNILKNAGVVVYDIYKKEYIVYCGNGTEDLFNNERSIDSVNVYRQPGSTLKPFLYFLALQNGYYPAKIISDASIKFKEKNGVFIPKNYDDTFFGNITFRKSLACSRNIPAVSLLQEIGVEEFLQFLRSMGFSSLNRSDEYYGLALALGSAEVSLNELVKAYAQLVEFMYSENSDKAACAYIIADILQDQRARSDVFGYFKLPYGAAIKTGTSQGFNDFWAVSFTSDKVIGVWTGNLNRTVAKDIQPKPYALLLMKKVLAKMKGHAVESRPFLKPENIKKGHFCMECSKLSQTGPIDIYYDEIPYCNCKDIKNDPVKIISPNTGSVFKIDHKMPLEYQKIQIKSNVVSNEDIVMWSINNDQMISGKKDIFFQLTPGEHTIKVTDQASEDEILIIVK